MGKDAKIPIRIIMNTAASNLDAAGHALHLDVPIIAEQSAVEKEKFYEMPTLMRPAMPSISARHSLKVASSPTTSLTMRAPCTGGLLRGGRSRCTSARGGLRQQGDLDNLGARAR